MSKDVGEAGKEKGRTHADANERSRHSAHHQIGDQPEHEFEGDRQTEIHNHRPELAKADGDKRQDKTTSRHAAPVAGSSSSAGEGRGAADARHEDDNPSAESN